LHAERREVRDRRIDPNEGGSFRRIVFSLPGVWERIDTQQAEFADITAAFASGWTMLAPLSTRKRETATMLPADSRN
jgi:hypothetical protein